jgi:hypothetical protein
MVLTLGSESARSYRQQSGSSCLVCSQDDLLELLQAASPPAAAALPQESLSQLFRSALRRSGPDAAAAAAGAAAAALLDSGLVGCGAHRRRHPVIPQRPPYDEFRWGCRRRSGRPAGIDRRHICAVL